MTEFAHDLEFMFRLSAGLALLGLVIGLVIAWRDRK